MFLAEAGEPTVVLTAVIALLVVVALMAFCLGAGFQQWLDRRQQEREGLDALSADPDIQRLVRKVERRDLERWKSGKGREAEQR